MNKFKKLLPGHDFKDDISEVPRYSSPCTNLMGFDQPFGDVPEILDPTKTFQLGLGVYDLKGDWTREERARVDRPRDVSYLSIPRGISIVSTRDFATPRDFSRSTPRDIYTYDASDFQAEEMPESEIQINLRPKWSDRMREKMKRVKKSGPSNSTGGTYFENMLGSGQELPEAPRLTEVAGPTDLSGPASSALLIRSLARKTVIMRPVDSLADLYPQLIGPILLIETLMVSFALYEVYVLLDGVFQTIKALCLPLILLSKLFGV